METRPGEKAFPVTPFLEMGTQEEEHWAGFIEATHIQHLVKAVNSTVSVWGLLSLRNPARAHPFLPCTTHLAGDMPEL